MSELFMECEEEDLEPWQKSQIPEVNLVDDNDDDIGGGGDDDDDDDDEPIFIGELTTNQRNKTAPVKGNMAGRNMAGRPGLPSLVPRPTRGPAQNAPRPTRGPAQKTPSDMYKAMPGKGVKSITASAPAMTTMTPQPVIVNNQGFIVTPSELSTNRELITALGKQYPPGTTFTIFPASQPQLLQPMSQASVLPGVVHRPQVQQINNNIVTLSNVQGPAVYSSSQLPKLNQHMIPSVQSFSAPIKTLNKIDQTAVKRRFTVSQQLESLEKRTKVDLVTRPLPPVVDLVESGNCPRCNMEFQTQDALKYHLKICTATSPDLAASSWPTTSDNKRIMLVSDFYYGQYDGDPQKQAFGQKTNTTFKCQSCLKILKNNIRFMNHMKHHLELEKQNSESYESHTTCQHCYRQYSTPFQLQCHIESAHTAFESSTNCKICELAFESEQVLLEHMKDTHKPGEMPYGCMVCNFRSSFFSEVENHFRTAHENTKDLLCPFCLKVHRSTHTYMQHFMKHQRKGIHRCGKCRLNFLTYKEKVDHKTHFHKTFRKPKALEGLPAGTKVTIRASYGGMVGNVGNAGNGGKVSGPSTPDLYISQETKVSKQPVKFQSITPPKPVSKVAVLATMVEKMKSKTTETKKRKAKTNLVLKTLRVKGNYTCIECHAPINDFFTHYPVMVNCGACKYRTSCKESFANHMIRFHSSVTKKDRKWKTDRRKSRTTFKATLACLDCDFMTSVSNGDAMTKHVIERPGHVCRVLEEKDVKGEAIRDVTLMEPTEVLFMVSSAPAAGPTVMDTAPVKSVEADGGHVYETTTVGETDEALKQSSSVADQHSDPVEPILVEDDAEEQQKPSELFCSSSSLDGALSVDPSEQSLGNSVDPDVGEQVTSPLEPPMSLPVLESLSNHIVVLDDPVHDSDTPHVEPETIE